MIVIMISGQARVGKTTLSNFIAEYCVHNNLTPKIIPFALSIKKQAAIEGTLSIQIKKLIVTSVNT